VRGGHERADGIDSVPMTDSIFSHKKFWAAKLTSAPELPMSREAMDALGWDQCDIVLVTGDAYVDHPSFGAALIGRLLEAQGFRVGIIAQPDWRSTADFTRLGAPALFFGVTSGNMDSMVNHYTADRKPRSDDAYSPGNQARCRPDRALIPYVQRCREAFRGVPVIIGGIEASLRRLAHYDYWSNSIRRSVLVDSKADLLVYGNGERPIVEIAHRLAGREPLDKVSDVRGTAVMRSVQPDTDAVRIPSFEEVQRDSCRFLESMRVIYRESNPHNARPIVQQHGDREVAVNPPAFPLATNDFDRLYELPFTRRPHSVYTGERIPAYEMIRHSVTVVRGCFGGCSFCSITLHEGRIIQSRSERSIVKEIETIRDRAEAFTGMISDIGGPTANTYGMNCGKPALQTRCRRLSCLYPRICRHLRTDHTPLLRMLTAVRKIEGIRKALVSSGIRHDLALKSRDYIRTLAAHHVGGHLKLAPEHTDPMVLQLMMKPSIRDFEAFSELFRKYSAEAGHEQYIVPYFIAGHPGSTTRSMLDLALWLKKNKFRPQQVQTFIPLPMTLAGAMHHAGRHPLILNRPGASWLRGTIHIPRSSGERAIQKALLRYHAPESHDRIREALRELDRMDLCGRGPRCLVPNPADPSRRIPRRKT